MAERVVGVLIREGERERGKKSEKGIRKTGWYTVRDRKRRNGEEQKKHIKTDL